MNVIKYKSRLNTLHIIKIKLRFDFFTIYFPGTYEFLLKKLETKLHSIFLFYNS